MTRTAKVLAAVFGLAYTVAATLGGHFALTGQWPLSAAGYAVATLSLIGFAREISRGMPPGDYTDDYSEPPPGRPRNRGRRVNWIVASRQARRELRRKQCRCNLYWTSLGAAHDKHCPQYVGTCV